MEIKPGYKQTEVGVLPKDWLLLNLKEIVENQKILSGIYKDKILYGSGKKIIKLGDVFNFDYFKPDSAQKVKLTNQEIKKYRVTIGDIIIALASVKLEGIGKVMLVDVLDEDTAYDHNVALIRIIKAIHNKYIFYIFKSDLIRKIIAKKATQVGTTFLKTSSILQFLIPLPPKKIEQNAIAETLSDIDSYILSIEQLIAKKRLIKQGVMQELLLPKEGWKAYSLFALADNKKELFEDGDWIEAEHLANHGVRFIQTGNIGIGKFVEKEEKKYICVQSFLKLNCKEIREGDLLICRLAEPAGRSCILPSFISETKTVTSVDVTIFRPLPTLANRNFLVQLFSTREWFKIINKKCGGTTHKRISRGILSQLIIRIPNLIEQCHIANILSDMDAEIESLKTKLTKANQLKQGMMQELLTGRIRLI